MKGNTYSTEKKNEVDIFKKRKIKTNHQPSMERLMKIYGEIETDRLRSMGYNVTVKTFLKYPVDDKKDGDKKIRENDGSQTARKEEDK